MNAYNEASWPPPFVLLNSPRAKSVHLKICRKKGLQLIVPRRFDAQNIPHILEQHRRWILRHWHHLESAHAFSDQAACLPQIMQLLAIDEEWHIDYQLKENVHKAFLEYDKDTRVITLKGNFTDNTMIFSVLKKWLQHKAKQHLIAELNKLSKITGLSYQSVSIRYAHTRWGSCSAKKRISLNFKLLFLPVELVQYVLLHELCHTVYLNHSQQFWKLVESFYSDYQNARRKLKDVFIHIPIWLES